MNKAQSPVSYQAVEWKGDFVKLLDQTLLPAEEIYEEITDYHQMMTAIKELKIRGARPWGGGGLRNGAGRKATDRQKRRRLSETAARGRNRDFRHPAHGAQPVLGHRPDGKRRR